MDIELHGVTKDYVLAGGARVPALRGTSLTIRKGEFVALVGPSGCGKTTLLTIVGLLSRPSGGAYRLGGQDVSTFSRREQSRRRSDSLGFIFQAYNLLPREKAWRNVMLPLTFRSVYRHRRKRLALEALEAVGLSHRAHHYPTQMSGGEQQRVAIARALINHPQLIVADEPTGNLDSRTGQEIMSLITRVAAESGATVVMATHDSRVAAAAQRIVQMKDGVVVSDSAGR